MSDPVLRNWSDEELLKFIQSSGVNSSMGMGDYAVDAGRALVLAYLFKCALQIPAFQHASEQRLGLNRLGLS